MSCLRILCLSACLILCAAGSGPASAAMSTTPSRDVGASSSANPELAPADRDPFISTFNSPPPPRLGKAAGDSVAIFGGPGTVEGKFQDSLAGGLPDRQGWTSVDETDQPMHWHISTFNATRLDTTMTGNHAYWCGEASPVGWATPPGYGNGWNNALGYDWTVPDPSQSHAVRLQFVFHHDTEPGYDFFQVQVDSAGTWLNLGSYTGYNGVQNWGDPPQSPVVFDRTIQFQGNDYGLNGDQVSFRLRFSSDGAWSDEDGLWDTPFGAVQVDNIRVDVDGVNVSTADFEGSAGDADWAEVRPPFAGDFFKVLVGLIDLDPCRENPTPVATFIDDGTPPNNAPGQSTGGSFAANPAVAAAYGNSPVLNYTGGLSQGQVALNNWMISPPFAWDNPNTTADTGLDDGAFLRFDVYQDLPLLNGLFFQWEVRSRAAGEQWQPWDSHGFVYYSSGVSTPRWVTKQSDVRELLVDDPDSVQLRIGVIDLALDFGFPGIDATPAPYFDNVSFYRYDHGGPSIVLRRDQLFQDAFPNHDVSLSSSSLIDHAVRLDTSLPGFLMDTTGDSMVVEVTSNGVGVSLSGPPVMQWALEANPRYAGVRSLPAGAIAASTNARGWTIYTGVVLGLPAKTKTGIPVADKYTFDLPDGFGRPYVPTDVDEPAMFFPGDRLRFAVLASDDLGRTNSLPRDVSGLVSGEGFDPAFTVRALPTQTGTPSADPKVLVWQDGGYQTRLTNLDPLTHRRGEFDELVRAMAELGMTEGTDFDVFVSRSSESVVDELGASEGLGATVDQLSQYSVLLYNAEDRFVFPADAVNPRQPGGPPMYSSTVGAIDAWRALSGTRTALWFGDGFLATGTNTFATPAMLDFVANSLGVVFLDDQVLDDIGGEINPLIDLTPAGTAAGLSADVSFYVRNGCYDLRNFAAITAGPGAVTTHQFTDAGGGGVTGVAAGVLFERMVAGDVKRDFTFPFGLSAVDDPSAPGQDPRAARAALLGNLLSVAGLPTGGGIVPAPAARGRLEVDRARPNPFNPATEIRWSAPASGHLKIAVHDLRGRQVAVLLDGEVSRGTGELVWEGRDTRGASVASGVYLISVEGFGQVERQKVVLVE